jgi:hypothetical protein
MLLVGAVKLPSTARSVAGTAREYFCRNRSADLSFYALLCQAKIFTMIERIAHISSLNALCIPPLSFKEVN